MPRKTTTTADLLAAAKAAMTDAVAAHDTAVAAADEASATFDAVRDAIATGTAVHSAEELASARHRADYAALAVGAKAKARTEAEAAHRVALAAHYRLAIAGDLDQEGTGAAIEAARHDLTEALARLVKAQRDRNAQVQEAIIAAGAAGILPTNGQGDGLALSGWGKITRQSAGPAGRYVLYIDGESVPQHDVRDVVSNALDAAAKASRLNINLQSVQYIA